MNVTGSRLLGTPNATMSKSGHNVKTPSSRKVTEHLNESSLLLFGELKVYRRGEKFTESDSVWELSLAGPDQASAGPVAKFSRGPSFWRSSRSAIKPDFIFRLIVFI